jgi:hypothetical protein
MKQWIERRHQIRQHLHIAGTAVSCGGLDRLPVYVVNLSRTGAMVELPKGATMPEQVDLLFEHSAEPCRKIWHEGSLVGVEFIDT